MQHPAAKTGGSLWRSIHHECTQHIGGLHSAHWRGEQPSAAWPLYANRGFNMHDIQQQLALQHGIGVYLGLHHIYACVHTFVACARTVIAIWRQL